MQLSRKLESWNPFRELEDLSRRFDQALGLTRGNGEREMLAATDWAPSCEISENEREYRVRAELPSVKKEDVHVTLEKGVLTIQGDRREEKEEKGLRYHRKELAYGHFLRRFTMPDDADESKVDANFKDGMLSVVIAKLKSKQPSVRQIAVQ